MKGDTELINTLIISCTVIVIIVNYVHILLASRIYFSQEFPVIYLTKTTTIIQHHHELWIQANNIQFLFKNRTLSMDIEYHHYHHCHCHDRLWPLLHHPAERSSGNSSHLEGLKNNNQYLILFESYYRIAFINMTKLEPRFRWEKSF
jgi:hypothetical protein